MALPALENRVHLDWFKTHTQESMRRYLQSSSGSAADLLGFLSPFSATYHSPLNPIFLAECESLHQLDFAPTWLARDGLVPLLWFFSRFPVPRDFKGRIYLDAELAALAPQAWHSRVGTYRFGELPRSMRPRGFVELRPSVTRLILLGISAPSFCGIEHLRTVLPKARKQFASRFGRPPREILVCLNQKPEPLGTIDQASRHSNQVMLEICKEFGTKVQVLDLRDFELGTYCNGAAVLELNEKLLCADSALVHLAVGKGALLLDEPLGAKAATYDRATLSHGFELRENPARETPAARHALGRRLAVATDSNAVRNFPWQFWRARDADAEIVVESPITAFPRALAKGARRYSVVPTAPGSIEVAYLGTEKLEIHGWCMDQVHDRAPEEVVIVRKGKRLLGNVNRTARADVQRSMGRTFDETFRPGFEFQLPRGALKDLKKGEPFSVYCLFGHDLAAFMGTFRADFFSRDQKLLPQRNRAMGSYIPIRVGKERLEFQLKGPGSRPVTYALSESGAHYQARIDQFQNQDGELLLSGWAADFLRGTPAEAVVLYDGGDQALAFPLLERRIDVAKGLDCTEISGFYFKAPWVRPRIFILYDSGVALELAVPASGGSA